MRILISGASSGLGASLLKRFGGMAFRRSAPVAGDRWLSEEPFEMIVHCAVDTAKQVGHDAIDTYFHNNVELTRRLLAIPHRRFVYLSSVDVYPKSSALWCEDDAINAHDIAGVYGVTKFYAEALVKTLATAPLIVRAGALLGPIMRENSLLRMFTKPGSMLGLSGASTFNYVLHDDIGDVIGAAGLRTFSGIVNCGSSVAVTLDQIRHEFGLDVRFGSFLYRTPEIDNQRAVAMVPALARSSLETVRLFWEEYRAYPIAASSIPA